MSAGADQDRGGKSSVENPRAVTDIVQVFNESKGQDPRTRRYLALVLGLLGGMIAVGGSLALVGAAAASISQPRYVWYPLLVIGGASGVIGLVILPVLRRRFAADELRRIDALDAGSRS